jgi:hypothetical protein
LRDFKGKDRLLIVLDQALAGDVVANLMVFDGDKLFIPVKTSTMSVVGEVRRQGACAYQKNYDVKDYLSLSCRRDSYVQMIKRFISFGLMIPCLFGKTAGISLVSTVVV